MQLLTDLLMRSMRIAQADSLADSRDAASVLSIAIISEALGALAEGRCCAGDPRSVGPNLKIGDRIQHAGDDLRALGGVVPYFAHARHRLRPFWRHARLLRL